MNERTIFLEALEQPTPEQRDAFLAQVCGENAALRAKIDDLLRAHNDAGSFIEHSPASTATARMARQSQSDTDDPADQSVSSKPPAAGVEVNLSFLSPSSNPGLLGRLGNYEILEVLGRGAFGIVLRAHDPKLNRIVAIKVLLPELAANAMSVRRFLKEAQAAAAVSHDHVVTIYAVDDTHSLPFLVMECILGQSLQERISTRGALPVNEILRIGMQVASGLAAAHKQGLVHRDIKPGNILLENGILRVKITDFGPARSLDDLATTQTFQVAGTPQYMSPEQAEGVTIDQRSDLFSLGSVLYTLCTGRAAFRADSIVAILKRVCDDTPRPIRELNPEVPDWLCEIVNKLLEKKPADRYQSAAEVAELLGQNLADVQQHKSKAIPAAAGKKSKFVFAVRVMRFRTMACGLLLLLILGLASGAYLWPKATPTRPSITETVRSEIPVDDDHASVETSQDPLQKNRQNGAADIPQPTAERISQSELNDLRDAVAAAGTSSVADQENLRSRLVSLNRQNHGSPEHIAIAKLMSRLRWPADMLNQTSISQAELNYAGMKPGQPPGELVAVFGTGHLRHWSAVRAIAFSPDGRLLATPGYDGVINVWDTNAGESLVRLQQDPVSYEAVGFSADGSTLIAWASGGRFHVWDVATWESRPPIPIQGGAATGLWTNAWMVFSSDAGLLVATGQENTVLLYDVRTGKLKETFRGHASPPLTVGFSRDGQTVASGDEAGTAIVWDVATGRMRRKIEPGPGSVSAVSLDSDGKLLAVGYTGRTISLTNLEQNDARQIIAPGVVSSLTFSPSGHRLLAGSGGIGGLREIDVERGKVVRTIEPAFPYSQFPLYSPDGSTIACGSWEYGVGLWDATTGARRQGPKSHKSGVHSVAVSPDGSLLAAGGLDGNLVAWHLEDGAQVQKMNSNVRHMTLAFANEPNRLFVGLNAGNGTRSVGFWDLSTGRSEQSLQLAGHEWWLAGMAVAPSGSCVVSADKNHVVSVWELNGLERLSLRKHTAHVSALAVSPDGSLIASAGGDERVRIWDAWSGSELQTLITTGAMGKSLTFSPDGKTLACGASESKIRLWEVSTGRELAVLEGHAANWHGVSGVAYNPAQTLLASCSGDGTVRIWNAEKYDLRNTIAVGPSGAVVNAVTFLPDGRHLATANENGTVYVLRLESVADALTQTLPQLPIASGDPGRAAAE